MYQCEAVTVEGFVQQVAVSYLAHGYYFYAMGWVPEGKDPATVDRKLIDRYGVDISKWARARRKQLGQASIQYLRFGRVFILLATHGNHPFFEQETTLIRDARKIPVKFAGYSISYRGGHPHVRIERREYLRLKAYYLNLALHRRAESLAQEFTRFPYEPYAPVRRQLFNILRAVNRVRKTAGYAVLPHSCLRLRRKIVRVFAAELADEYDRSVSERLPGSAQPVP